MKKFVQKQIEDGKQSIILAHAIRAETITRGLRSALATGNWGKDKQGDV